MTCGLRLDDSAVYRPICVLNVSFKVFTKALANRLTAVADKSSETIANSLYAR